MFAGHSYTTWILFHVLIFALLGLDLGVLNRKNHVIKMKEALVWSVIWIAIGLLFSLYIARESGPRAAGEYLTGYVVEKSLSVDNLFVFIMIFRAFKIERMYQHRLLFWGILGAIILRGAMIAAGSILLQQFSWLIYVFGVFLVYTGIQLFCGGDKEFDPLKSKVFLGMKKFLPFSSSHHPGHFTIVEHGKRLLTMEFAALVAIETSDVMFALDSVPAVFGVTRDPFIVYTSNIFAILGLRSLYFVLEDMMERFHLLKYGLAVVLTFVGLKMMISGYYHMNAWVSLAVILGVLVASVVLSLKIPPKKKA